MQELDDNALLREYVERGSEEAFAALVTRHINKVYSAALRHTSNPNQAEEITQAVFVTLAEKARRLNRHVILSGWLYQTARLTAVTLIRSEIRRGRREQEVYMQNAGNENETQAWRQIAPLLDAAMAGLNESDRHAVVLRFFDGKSMREVGAALGATEDTARKRVNRAMEKLQTFFNKRGITSTTAMLSAAISSHSVHAAPAVLAKSVTAAALAQAASSGNLTLTFNKGALKVMAWSKAKTAAVAVIGILLAGGATVIVSASAARKAREKDFVSYEVLQPSWMQKVFNRSVSDEELSRQLVGVWELEALRPPQSTNYIFLKPHNNNLKIRTATDWSIVGNEGKTNSYSAGGPYTVKNQVYTEHIENATGYMAKAIGHTPQFKIRVEGDKCYQLGLHGNFVHEVWHRVQQ
jgi:RNA polymerase sigma factor (sigma-70 family)